MSDAHRQGIVSAKEAQFFFTRHAQKGSAHAVSEGVFLRRCNEFLICPQEKSKWKIGYPRLVFVVFYYMSHEPGFIWATSCLLLFFAFCQGEDESLLLAATRLSVIFWLHTKTDGGHVFAHLPPFAGRCCIPPLSRSPFVFLIIRYCIYNARLVSSGKKEKSSFHVRLPGLFRSWTWNGTYSQSLWNSSKRIHVVNNALL